MRQIFLLLLIAIAALASAQLPRKGFFGAQILPPTAEQKGLSLGTIVPGSTAAGGLQTGDVLLKLNGTDITSPQQIGAAMSSALPGSKLQAVVLRSGKETAVELTVMSRPVDKGDNYEVIYDEVVSHGARLRTLISRPTKVSGKRPVMFLIQGIGYVSQESPLSGTGPYSRILKRFSDKGFVTVRAEKPGLGDSEGGPANTVDYERDMDSFRQGLKSIFSGKYDFVDTDNVFIFGHSMGGCEGPILATEFPVKGLAVYGTVVRTWEEYTIQNTRRQAILGGEDYSNLDGEIRKLIGAQNLLMTGDMSPDDIKAKMPKPYSEGLSLFSPDGKTMSGMPIPFWKQCYSYNYASYWQKVKCDVLSLWGENEFIASYEDHPLIATIVNQKNPGKAEYKLVPGSDHGFKKTTSMEDSFKNWGKPGGEMNPIVIDMLEAWVDKVLAAK